MMEDIARLGEVVVVNGTNVSTCRVWQCKEHAHKFVLPVADEPTCCPSCEQPKPVKPVSVSRQIEDLQQACAGYREEIKTLKDDCTRSEVDLSAALDVLADLKKAREMMETIALFIDEHIGGE